MRWPRQAEGADIEKQDTEDGDAADKVQRDISPCTLLRFSRGDVLRAGIPGGYSGWI